jgi:hypothetical protein
MATLKTLASEKVGSIGSPSTGGLSLTNINGTSSRRAISPRVNSARVGISFSLSILHTDSRGSSRVGLLWLVLSCLLYDQNPASPGTA